jgi:rhodanese-related sulfurtransferase
VEDFLIFIQEQIWLVAALAIFIGLFLRRESSQTGSKLSIGEVVQALNADKAVLVDLRDSKDFSKGHIANAVNIPHNKVNENLSILEKHKNKQVILTDALGQHSGSVGRELTRAGYTVARMDGGMNEWKQQGLPLVN